MTESVPCAVRNIRDGLADLHDAVRRTQTYEDAQELLGVLKQITVTAAAVQLLATNKVDDFSTRDIYRERVGR